MNIEFSDAFRSDVRGLLRVIETFALHFNVLPNEIELFHTDDDLNVRVSGRSASGDVDPLNNCVWTAHAADDTTWRFVSDHGAVIAVDTLAPFATADA